MSLMAWTRALFPRWKGHNVHWREILGPSQSRLLLPWGFLSDRDVLAKVAPRIQRLKEESKLDPSSSSSSSSSFYHHHHHHHASNEMTKELFHSLSDDFTKGSQQAYLAVVQSFLAPPCISKSSSSSSSSTFTQSNYCTPDLSCFLEDVKRSYAEAGVQPLLQVDSVEAKLMSLRTEEGLLSKNTYMLFGGTMGREEALTHIWEGVIGPEGRLLQELEGDVPRRLVAEVEMNVKEKFRFVGLKGEEKEGGREGGGEGEGRTHFFTFESDWVGGREGREEELEWVISNINDVVVSPSLSRVLMQG